MNNLDKILSAITSEAEEKISAIRSQSEEECKAVQTDCENKICDLHTLNAQKISRERELILSRAESSADMRRREIMLGARAGLLDKAYADAEKYICEMDRDVYKSFLAHLLCDALCDRIDAERALAEAGEETEALSFVLCLNKADRDELGDAVIAAALELAGERGVTVPEISLCDKPCDIRGGFILRGGDVETDCTVRTLVAASRSQTEAEAARVLFS